MANLDHLIKQADNFLARAEHALKSVHLKPKFTVWWRNPDHQDQWETYQQGLSKAKAEELSKKITYVLGMHWFNKNISTKILPDDVLI